ncbi:hypothetical protein LSG31_15315 [Fodinisporobacter ferrooxydans]|uniref:Uncharacterized protein n=1 Tax=Fodinisporobacter ferrooxydans TaxID=2901836 RepID=A0ABY4CFG0_9BACL|nr:hypothetical protein LSG31_15315 [Alicyclobacillaceae bacterium MYW30-H2]
MKKRILIPFAVLASVVFIVPAFAAENTAMFKSGFEFRTEFTTKHFYTSVYYLFYNIC